MEKYFKGMSTTLLSRYIPMEFVRVKVKADELLRIEADFIQIHFTSFVQIPRIVVTHLGKKLKIIIN